MRIRPYHPADKGRLLDIYGAEGFKFALDVDNPRFVTKLVLVDHGQVQQAVFGRMTAEGFLFMDHTVGTPVTRRDNFRKLLEAAEDDLMAQGFEDVHCWLPPSHARFGRRLVKDFLWVRDDAYTPYCKYLVPK